MNHKGKNGLNLGSKDSRKNVQPEMLISALENIPGGFHQCALEEGYPFLYMNERFLEILGWTKEEIEEQFDNKFTNLMADEYRDLVDNFVARILEGSSAKETKRQIYRLKSKNGLIWVSDATNLVREGDYTFLQGIITDINDYVLERFAYEKELANSYAIIANRDNMISALSNDYTMAYLCDLEKDTIQVIKQEETNPFFSVDEKLGCYTTVIAYFRDHILSEKYAQDFWQHFKREALMETLKHQDVWEYRGQNIPGVIHFENFACKVAKLNPLDTNDFQVISGLQSIDSIVQKDNAHQRELEAMNEKIGQALVEEASKNEIISALSNLYFEIAVIDLEKQTYSSVSGPDKKFIRNPRTGKISEMVQLLLEHNVCKENWELAKQFMDFSTVQERLKNKTVTSIELRTKQYIWYTLSFIVKNRDEQGNVTHILMTANDINEQKEQELNYKEQMEMAIVKANRANREKTLFLRRMSHDIRTPLNGILGMIHLADKNKDNVEKLYDYRQKTIHSAEYLMDLVNNILDISKLESGSMVLDDKPFDLFALLERQTEVIEAYANDNTVQLINAIDHQKMKHRYLIGSKNYLNRILINLASNAVKYNHVGGWVKLNCEEIFDDGDSCVYEFICQDNGLGMSEEFQRHAFEPFCREGKESTTTLSGTGLGLSIVKEIAELMHGTIQLKSKEGEGTTFVVTIPFKIDPHPQPENKELVIPENISFKGQTAMLVEDNDVNMEIAHFFLEELGFQIVSAKNGKEALELFQKEPENTFDFIFMDVMMPVMDGLEATKRIRALPSAYARKIPILAMTANAFQEDRQSCLEVGMNGHIAKPLKKEDIIKELLRSQEAK